jgi:DNA repair ATPase RecN
LEVEEEKVTPTKQTIGFQWIKANLLDIDNPPKGIGLDEIVKAKEKENEFNKQITQAKERITLLEKEQERARKNKSVVMDQENSVEITRSIMDSEKEIKKLTNQLPELEAAAQIAAKNVSDAIKKLRTTIA